MNTLITQPTNLHIEKQKAGNCARAGWICFSLALGGSAIPFAAPLSLLLLLASFILGVCSMAKGDIGHGIALVLLSFYMVPVVILTAFLVMTAIGYTPESL